MSRMEHFALVTDLVDRLGRHGSWCGETHIQKAAFVAQEMLGVPLGHEFVLYKHGPYSFELTDELTAMRANDLMELHIKDPRYGPCVSPTERAEKNREKYEGNLAQYADKLEFVATRLGGKGVKDLEKIATAFFVTKELGERTKAADRTRRLCELKPHIQPEEAKVAMKEVDNLLEAARKDNLIAPIAA